MKINVEEMEKRFQEHTGRVGSKKIRSWKELLEVQKLVKTMFIEQILGIYDLSPRQIALLQGNQPKAMDSSKRWIGEVEATEKTIDIGGTVYTQNELKKHPVFNLSRKGSNPVIHKGNWFDIKA